jgi:iron complex outermembrane receptor protein
MKTILIVETAMRPASLPFSLVLLALLASPTRAQSASSEAHARAAIALATEASDTLIRRNFRIHPQPLGTALEAFTRQAGVQVRTEAKVPAAVRSPGVTGRLTPVEALRRLVAGTGFVAEVVDAETLALRPASDAYESWRPARPTRR